MRIAKLNNVFGLLIENNKAEVAGQELGQGISHVTNFHLLASHFRL